MWYMHEGPGWWMLFGGVWLGFIWGGLIALAVWLIAKLTRSRPEPKHADPLVIARERYARGEISRQEYEQIKSDITGKT